MQLIDHAMQFENGQTTPRRPLVSPVRHSSYTQADNMIGWSDYRTSGGFTIDKSLHSNVYGL